MLEEARVLGELRKQGWTPKRTIIYCAWDGEEPGLLGSVEWVETHVDDLRNMRSPTSIPTAVRVVIFTSAAHKSFKPWSAP